MDHMGNELRGLDAEIFLKIDAKRDRNWERRVLEWVQVFLTFERYVLRIISLDFLIRFASVSVAFAVFCSA